MQQLVRCGHVCSAQLAYAPVLPSMPFPGSAQLQHKGAQRLAGLQWQPIVFKSLLQQYSCTDVPPGQGKLVVSWTGDG
jgi:hypothetical protein